ncbi:hypothetical protein BC936DRAFT_139909 [Jimgerdemannia flammicorona]|uniref:Methyltransferase type 11 domain-containing protein n=1 Tax=Jimgerdemannia flammicorona TaxID=994334 RepID=A0A433B8Y7_9FUNG|nr:hypothetical protein BC936DRAFT_139909 [Jimgerdemannia flammicorona]
MAGNVQSKSFSRGKSSSLKGFLDKLLQRKNSADVPSPGPSTTTDSDPSPVPLKPKFRWDDGRRFHDVEGAAYTLPNDEEEIDRNFRAPVHELLTEGAKLWPSNLDDGAEKVRLNQPAKIIIHGQELAYDYPISQFYGVDISHVFPDTIKPPNCHFQIANVLDGLPFPDNTFDYVNQRMLTFAIKENEWPSLITEILRVTKPNGWVEFLEFDLQSYNRGPLNTEGLKPTRKLDRFLVKAGVVNVAKDWVSIPLNWGGRLGQLFYDDVREVLISFRPYLTKVTGLSNEEYDAKIKASLEECKEYKTYNNFYAAWGQAPDESAEKV